MALVFRKITKRVFIISNIVSACFFLLACCNVFLHPQQWWFIALLGLAFPFLLAIIVAFLIFWLAFRSKWVLLPFGCLLIGYSNIRSLVGLNIGRKYTFQKPKNAIRILTWNVTWFDEQTRTEKTRITYRNDMMAFMRKENPDIICFQEYLEPNTKRKAYNNKDDLTKMGYPFHIIAYDYIGYKGTFLSGVAIYSKFPIIDSLHIRYNGPASFKAAESLLGADINVNGDTIRMFTTHLQSVLFNNTDYRNIEIIKTAADSMYEASKSVVKKLVQGYRYRGQQVDVVRKYLDESPHPAIICGDFNDVPNSYTYFRIRGNRKDAFIEAGKGIGRTLFNLSPTLRIDYIITDKRFETLQYFRYFLPYSQHYPVIADITLRDTAN
ncbi:MAG: endonuclease/exonuclease/phosphatase family protein [Flavitalea sp.]